MRIKYQLERDVFDLTKLLVRRYYNLKYEHEAVLEASPPPPDGQPRGRGTGKGDVERKAIRLAEIDRQIDAIEKAQKIIPKEYMPGVWEHIVEKRRFPDFADRGTWYYYQRKYLFFVATEMFWI